MREPMDLRRLQRLVINALEDVKGQEIQVFNTSGLSDLFDRVVLVSATSNRQCRSLASHVAEQAKLAGAEVLSVEGSEVANGCWSTWATSSCTSCSLRSAPITRSRRSGAASRCGSSWPRPNAARVVARRTRPARAGVDARH